MRTSRPLPSVVHRVPPWLLRWGALQAAVGVAGRLAARRKDEGDESTAGIRRVVVLGGVRLRPAHPQLSRVRLDVLMGGAELDLTAVPRVPGGVDLTVRMLLGGVQVQVPAGWRVWWSCRGPGGVRVAEGAEVLPTDDERGADLRVHADVALGGIGLGTVPPGDRAR